MAAAQNPTPDPSASADPAPDALDAQAADFPAAGSPDAGSPDADSPDGDSPGGDSPDGSADMPAAGPADVKARFRDALERKRSQHADSVGGSGPSSGKVHDVHGRAGGKRQFRRKSGG
jgi:uncharacterized protein DUF5302